MGAKQSSEMREALRLIASGVPTCKAANTAGVHYRSLLRAVKLSKAKETKLSPPAPA